MKAVNGSGHSSTDLYRSSPAWNRRTGTLRCLLHTISHLWATTQMMQ